MDVTKGNLKELVSEDKLIVFYNIVDKINSLYEMEKSWNDGGKRWIYEYKFRRSGKTLCAFYFKKDILGLMIIFGKAEREKILECRSELSDDIIRTYDEANTYHDGKWVTFDINEKIVIDDIIKLLFIKRRPNRRR